MFGLWAFKFCATVTSDLPQLCLSSRCLPRLNRHSSDSQGDSSVKSAYPCSVTFPTPSLSLARFPSAEPTVASSRCSHCFESEGLASPSKVTATANAPDCAFQYWTELASELT